MARKPKQSVVHCALLALLLLSAGPAWGQTYDTLGWRFNATDALNIGTANRPAWNIYNYQAADTGVVYVAGPNDSVISIHAYFNEADSTIVGLWTFNTGTSRPVSRVAFDTVFKTTGGIGWESKTLTTKWALTPSQAYSYAGVSIGNTQGLRRVSGIGIDNSIATHSTTPGMPATYSSDDEGWSGLLCIYMVIGQYGAGGGGSAAATQGAGTAGAGTAGGK